MHRTQRIAILGHLVLLAGCPAPAPTLDAGEPLDVGAADGPTPDVRTGTCVGDDECSDGSFCNGHERCDASAVGADERGCAPSRGRPCLDAQICLEATDECETDCGVDRDADDDGIDAHNCPGGTDCDDADALRHPGLLEVCDAEDHDEDCDDTTFGARDIDRDGALDARCCNEGDAGVRACGDDCNDALRSVRPLGVEMCDGLDNDCNAVVDEGVTVVVHPDVDRDLHGDDMRSVMACLGAVGVSPYDDDCDDSRPQAHGAQVEICDEIDNDCDARVDENARAVTWYRDADGDGFGAAASGTMVSCAPLVGYSLLPTDCDDSNGSRSPVAVEICDGVDDDCNGLADFALGASDREDDDGDGHADAACGGDDCDDGDWSAYPGAPEICDQRDSDCDGLSDGGVFPTSDARFDTTVEVDWFSDADQDGWGVSTGAIRSCQPQAGRVTRAGDCADLDPTRHPTAVDVCDGIDDDCDASIDEDAPALAFYADADGDRDGDGPPTLACSLPSGLVAMPGDCAPADPSRGSGAIETCNAGDDDCDGMIDELLFRDADGDGHGDPDRPVTAICAPGDVGVGDDCNDADPLVGGDTPCVEICNGDDDDGDDMTDEPGAEASCPNSDTSNWTCISGACVLAGCRTLAGDCNGIPSDGCELDLRADARRCGSCTNACDIGEVCAAGMCGDPIVGIACGHATTMAFRQSGSVVFWGQGGTAAAGPDTRDFIPSPSYLVGASEIELRMGRGCAMVAGERLCWGAANAAGYTGTASSVLGNGVIADVVTPAPFAVASVDDVALGLMHTCVVGSTREVRCWGGPTGVFRALGDGLATASTTPVTVLGLDNAVGVEAGTHHTCAIRTDGRAVCWGENGTRLGIGTAGARDYPLEPVELIDGTPLANVVELAISTGNGVHGGSPTCARLGAPDRGVMCWGDNFHQNGTGSRGALGIDDGGTISSVPYAVSVVSGPGSTAPLMGATRIAAGFLFTCAELSGGSLVCWGNNDAGQLGLGTTAFSAAPRPVPIPAFDDWCVGHEHACALLDDGSVWCWGSNAYGQCGQDGVSTVLSPTEVIALRRGPL